VPSNSVNVNQRHLDDPITMTPGQLNQLLTASREQGFLLAVLLFKLKTS